jgi:hypothetical protein
MGGIMEINKNLMAASSNPLVLAILADGDGDSSSVKSVGARGERGGVG